MFHQSIISPFREPRHVEHGSTSDATAAVYVQRLAEWKSRDDAGMEVVLTFQDRFAVLSDSEKFHILEELSFPPQERVEAAYNGASTSIKLKVAAWFWYFDAWRKYTNGLGLSMMPSPDLPVDIDRKVFLDEAWRYLEREYRCNYEDDQSLKNLFSSG